MDLEFKKVREKNLDQALDMLSVFLDDKEIMTTFERKQRLILAQDHNSYQLYGAYDENKLLGVIGIKPVFNPIEDRGVYEADNLVVDEEHRGKGVAKFILQSLFSQIKEQGVEFCKFYVTHNNKKAENLYKKLEAQNAEVKMMYFKM